MAVLGDRRSFSFQSTCQGEVTLHFSLIQKYTYANSFLWGGNGGIERREEEGDGGGGRRKGGLVLI